MFKRISTLIFPPKCVLCNELLSNQETDLCRRCRLDAPIAAKSKFKLSFVARWTAVWYYKDNARSSLLRFKFSNKRCYAQSYGRFLAMKLQTEEMDDFDVLTWVPVGFFRQLKRGYDQDELIARVTAAELGKSPAQTLLKIKNTPPQSGIRDASMRRANVLNAYRVTDPELIRDKRILLIDDIITTGATVSECARVLLTAGAKEVNCAAVAVALHDKK